MTGVVSLKGKRAERARLFVFLRAYWRLLVSSKMLSRANRITFFEINRVEHQKLNQTDPFQHGLRRMHITNEYLYIIVFFSSLFHSQK